MARQIKTQLVIEGKNDASKAFKEADKQLGGISSAAKKAGAALLGAFSAVAITNWVRNSINAADEARKLAQAAGFTTEAFTGLKFAASQSGVGINELSGGLTRLSRTMSDAATIGGRPAEVFKRLGLSLKDSEGNLRSADSVLSDLADIFQDMPDGVGKTAAAVELLGRSGARLIPLLNGGSEGIKALTDQAERLGLVITDEQAAASERFNDTLAALAGVSSGAGNTIAGELLPVLNEMSGLLLELSEDGDSASVFAAALGFSFKILATEALVLVGTLGILGKALIASGKAALAAAYLNFDEATQIFKDYAEESEKSARDTADRVKRLWNGELGREGEAAAKVVGDFREAEQAAKDAITESNQAFAKSYSDTVAAAKAALRDLVSEEKRTQKEIEDIRKARIEIEQRYAEAIAGFGRGKSGPSYAQAQDLKLAAGNSLRAGDYESASKQAQEALKVLQQLSDAGENTYGFAGFAKQLKGIELAAKDIESTRAEEKLKAIEVQAEQLNAKITELTAFDIKLELAESEKQKIISQIDEMRNLLGMPILIQAEVLPPTSLPPALQGSGTSGGWNSGATGSYASGGRIRGPGTGTSDSILARLSNGEYVIKAAAVRKYGTNLLDNLNGMQIPKYADGGMVGAVSAAGGGGGSTLNLSLDGQNYALSGQADTIADLANAVRKANLKRR